MYMLDDNKIMTELLTYISKTQSLFYKLLELKVVHWIKHFFSLILIQEQAHVNQDTKLDNRIIDLRVHFAMLLV